MTNLIYRIIDFQGACNPCCYYVLLLRPHIWIDSPEAPSLARSQNLHLSCLFTHFIEEHVRELGGPLASGMSLRLEVALLAAYLSNL